MVMGAGSDSDTVQGKGWSFITSSVSVMYGTRYKYLPPDKYSKDNRFGSQANCLK
jgi:hypothetical protein